MSTPPFDPDYLSVEVFNKCTDKSPYRRTELYEKLSPSSTPCLELRQSVPVSLVGGNITISGATLTSYTYESYYYTDNSGAGLYGFGERLTRAFTTDGATITEYWFDENDTLGTAPLMDDVVPDGEPYPISTDSHIIDELPAVFVLTPASANVTLALIQIKCNDTLLASSYSNTADNMLAGDLVRWSMDGVNPTASTGYFAGHGSIIKLDGRVQIVNFKLIARTDSVSYGSDIRPELSVTYFFGIDKK
jgi:hypothetical protein